MDHEELPTHLLQARGERNEELPAKTGVFYRTHSSGQQLNRSSFPAPVRQLTHFRFLTWDTGPPRSTPQARNGRCEFGIVTATHRQSKCGRQTSWTLAKYSES